MSDSEFAVAYAVAQPLARAKATRFVALHRFAGFDREDIEAELLLRFWQNLPQFDGNRSSMSTFTSRAMDHDVISIARRAYTLRRSTNIGCRSLCDTVINGDGNPVEIGSTIADPRADVAIRGLDLSIDVDRLLERLPMGTRNVAIALSEGSPSEARESLGRSRTLIYRRIARLREVFVAAGLAPAFARGLRTAGPGSHGGVK